MSNFNLNKAILGGRLTSDVELRQTPQGVSVCQFTIAVNRKTSKEQEQQADFITCVAWRNTAEFISKYFKKGSSICIAGSIQTRNWIDGNGNKKYATEVIVDEAYFVDGKSDNQAETTPKFEDVDPFKSANLEELNTDDDLPF